MMILLEAFLAIWIFVGFANVIIGLVGFAAATLRLIVVLPTKLLLIALGLDKQPVFVKKALSIVVATTLLILTLWGTIHLIGCGWDRLTGNKPTIIPLPPAKTASTNRETITRRALFVAEKAARFDEEQESQKHTFMGSPPKPSTVSEREIILLSAELSNMLRGGESIKILRKLGEIQDRLSRIDAWKRGRLPAWTAYLTDLWERHLLSQQETLSKELSNHLIAGGINITPKAIPNFLQLRDKEDIVAMINAFLAVHDITNTFQGEMIKNNTGENQMRYYTTYAILLHCLDIVERDYIDHITDYGMERHRMGVKTQTLIRQSEITLESVNRPNSTITHLPDNVKKNATTTLVTSLRKLAQLDRDDARFQKTRERVEASRQDLAIAIKKADNIAQTIRDLNGEGLEPIDLPLKLSRLSIPVVLPRVVEEEPASSLIR